MSSLRHLVEAQLRAGPRERRGDRGDLLRGEVVHQIPELSGDRRRHPERPPGRDVLRRDLPGVLELDGDLRPVRVHPVGERAQARQEGVVGDRDLVRNAGARRIRDRARRRR